MSKAHSTAQQDLFAALEEKRRKDRERMRAWRAKPENRKAAYERQNARNKTPEGRAIRRAIETRHRSKPEANAKRKARRKGESRKFTPEQKARREIATRRYQLKQFGITLEQYKEMYRKQGGKCAICGTAQAGISARLRNFSADHCHVTGRFRGLLCMRCNMTVGRLGDTADAVRAWAEKAIQYLLT